MRGLLRHRPSPAMIVALLALFVTLGGSASALVVVTSRNIKNGTIRGKDIHRRTITSTRIKKNGLGGSVIKESSLGAVPNATGLAGPLASGKTETGVWATAGGSSTAGFSAAHFLFRPPLRKPLDANHVVFVTAASAAHCPGVGNAERGYLCVYRQQGAQTLQSIGDGKSAGAATDGAEMFVNNVNVNNFAAGHWAVTAP